MKGSLKIETFSKYTPLIFDRSVWVVELLMVNGHRPSEEIRQRVWLC